MKAKMYNWFKEIIRRIFQIVTGVFLFDMPGISVFRNWVVKGLICRNQLGGGYSDIQSCLFLCASWLTNGTS